MIIDFSIENFNGIKDKVTLSFVPDKSDQLSDYYLIEPREGTKLLKLGIIYGPNASGKTTILKALEFLRDLVVYPKTQKQQLLDFRPFLFDQETIHKPAKFEINFIHEKQKYRYHVSCMEQAVIAEELYFFSPNKALLYKRTTDMEKQLSVINFGPKAGIKKSAVETIEANTLWNTSVLASFLRTNVDSKELRDVTNWFRGILMPMVSPVDNLINSISQRLFNKQISKGNILQFLNKAAFQIDDVFVDKRNVPVTSDFKEIWDLLRIQLQRNNQSAFVPEAYDVEEFKISFSHVVDNNGSVNSFPLPYESESGGTKRYFQFSGLLDEMIRTSNVFPIDELESSLHPDLLKHFLLLFLVNTKSSQLIATTHYRELLLEKDILRYDAIWFTEKKANGATELFSLADFDSSIVRDTTSVFNAYRSGKLGAVPIVKDYYINQETDDRTQEQQ